MHFFFNFLSVPMGRGENLANRSQTGLHLSQAFSFDEQSAGRAHALERGALRAAETAIQDALVEQATAGDLAVRRAYAALELALRLFWSELSQQKVTGEQASLLFSELDTLSSPQDVSNLMRSIMSAASQGLTKPPRGKALPTFWGFLSKALAELTVLEGGKGLLAISHVRDEVTIEAEPAEVWGNWGVVVVGETLTQPHGRSGAATRLFCAFLSSRHPRWNCAPRAPSRARRGWP